MNWIKWNGGDVPPTDKKVVVLFSGDILTREECEKTKPFPAIGFNWKHTGNSDILEYAIVE